MMQHLNTCGPRWRERASRRSLMTIAVLVCLVLALALGLQIRRSGTEASTQTVGHLVGHAAPDFALPAVRDGQQVEAAVRLRAEHGQPVLLVFFFSLCPHCASTLENVHAVAAARGAAPVRVLYIDSPAETTSIASDYARRLELDAPVLLDVGGRVAAHYGVALYPATLLVDADGSVRGVWTGEVSEDTLVKAVDAL